MLQHYVSLFCWQFCKKACFVHYLGEWCGKDFLSVRIFLSKILQHFFMKYRSLWTQRLDVFMLCYNNNFTKWITIVCISLYTNKYLLLAWVTICNPVPRKKFFFFYFVYLFSYYRYLQYIVLAIYLALYILYIHIRSCPLGAYYVRSLSQLHTNTNAILGRS